VKNSWGNEWCSNGSAVENNVAYVAPNGGNNIMMAGDNMHYINATVTLTLGENDSDPITILVSAEKVKKGDETWQIVGDDPLAWDFTSAPAFEEGEDGVWTLAYNGSISGSFKIAHNGAWANCYSTTGLVEHYIHSARSGRSSRQYVASRWPMGKSRVHYQCR
jgi:hypothetical protein